MSCLPEELGELADTAAGVRPRCLEITGFAPAEIDSLLGDLVDPELDPADRCSSASENTSHPSGRSMGAWAPPAPLRRCTVGDRCAAPHGHRRGDDDDHRSALQPADQEGSGPRSDRAPGTSRKPLGKCPQPSSPSSCVVCSIACGEALPQRLDPLRVHGLAPPRRASCGGVGRLFRAQEPHRVGENDARAGQLLQVGTRADPSPSKMVMGSTSTTSSLAGTGATDPTCGPTLGSTPLARAAWMTSPCTRR